MGLFDKKISFGAVKDAMAGAATKVSETVQRFDVKGTITRVTETTASITERTTDATKMAYAATKEKAVSTYESVSEEVRSFDYTELRNAEYYRERYAHYTDLGSKKVSEYFRATFEVDKSTMEMVDDVRSRLPVPARTVDDIFEQCKREAMRRAIAAFALGNVVQNIDNRSEAKYANLSESYSEFRERSGFSMTDDPNFAAMKDIRYEAKGSIPTRLEDGYNKAQPLDPYNADIEHVVAKKEFYDDMLLRIGTTDDEFYSLINSPENLVFAESSFNRAMQETNIHDFLAKRGRPDTVDPNLVHVDITQQDGSIKTVTVNRQDIEDAYDRADAKRSEHRLAAAKEVGMTVVKTGATMAAQQVVGLIVLETIDIFVDEIRSFAVNGRIINEDGWLQNTKDATARVQQRLADRFEERQIWARAKSLGIEAGVAGALSVIPQILISLILKMPSFVLALIRECTLSIVRCVRVLASNDADKLESIKIILAGAAAAIVGVYVGRIISNGIAGVPLLNRFNAPITDVLTGLLVTAVPLTAIYTFEQNKHKLSFITSRFTGTSEQTA
jgi:hypothetical protein